MWWAHLHIPYLTPFSCRSDARQWVGRPQRPACECVCVCVFVIVCECVCVAISLICQGIFWAYRHSLSSTVISTENPLLGPSVRHFNIITLRHFPSFSYTVRIIIVLYLIQLVQVFNTIEEKKLRRVSKTKIVKWTTDKNCSCP